MTGSRHAPQAFARMPDSRAPARLWLAGKLRHLLQTLAFCLAIAALQVAFEPQRPWGPPLAYSIAIGVTIWAVVDLGRHLLPSARETGWPRGLQGWALVVGGIAAGWFIGNGVGDIVSHALGLFGAGPVPTGGKHLRNSVLITVVAGTIGTAYFYARSRSAWLQHKMGEAQRHADEARLKLLEAQLEPHMLFNTLANLRALIALDPPRAQRMLDHMIAYLRATLDGSRAAMHPLQSEFDRLRDYLELMAIRLGDRLAYELRLPQALQQHPVPTLLLQPLVENAIVHGLEPQVTGGRLTVAAQVAGGELLIEVVDTGAGIAVREPAGGFGLTQVRERLAAVYGGRGRLALQAASPHGTRASIRIPLEPT